MPARPPQAQAQAFTPGAALDDMFAYLPDLSSTPAASPTDSALFGDLGMFGSPLNTAPQPAFSATWTPGSTPGSDSTFLLSNSFSALDSAPLLAEMPPADPAQSSEQHPVPTVPDVPAANLAQPSLQQGDSAQGQTSGSGLTGNGSSSAVHSRPAGRRRVAVRKHAQPVDMPQPSSNADVYSRRTTVVYDDI